MLGRRALETLGRCFRLRKRVLGRGGEKITIRVAGLEVLTIEGDMMKPFFCSSLSPLSPSLSILDFGAETMNLFLYIFLHKFYKYKKI